ncbi:MAG: tyrosyl-tRNA synthetase [Actinomycetota bacterium]|nr:tyrosyl-tRNA synthetase [Actinomycetota bacterium]
MTHLLDDLAWRGLIAVSTDLGALREAVDAGPVTLYCGFDPTAPSLHIGHLMQLMTLRRFQQAGHRPVALVGGATGLIGDPKPTAERTLNDPTVVADWVDRIRTQVQPFLDFEGTQAAHAAVMANNLEWTAPLSAIELLRDVGRHFRVNKMIAKEVVSARLNSDEGISYTEFSYQILQSLDFLELYRRYSCTLQIGGSDQWGNLTAGLDLIHRVEGVSVHALATPLVTKADGTKFGKTEGGAIWLDPTMTSPYAFYQFWLNTDDRDVVRYLKIFSFRSRAEIEALAAAAEERPAARDAQRALAEELTALVHGTGECERVVAASAALFGRGELADLDAAILAAALEETGWVKVPSEPPPTVVDLLSASGLVDSKSAARRVLAEGGAYVNNRKITDPDAAIGAADLLHGRWIVLRRGKRSVAGVQVAE